MVSPSEMILNGPFKEAAGLAAIYEIRLRMVADIRESTRHVMFERAEDVEDLLIDEYKIEKAEAERLRTTRQLRNKILHGAFRKANAKLAELGGVTATADVRMVDLKNVPADPDAFAAALAGGKPVTDPDGTDSIFGWLFACAQNGFFSEAARAFQESMKILDRLAVAAGNVDV